LRVTNVAPAASAEAAIRASARPVPWLGPSCRRQRPARWAGWRSRGEHLKGRHEGIESPPLLAIEHAGVELRNRDRRYGQRLLGALQEDHGLGLIPQVIDQHIGVNHQQRAMPNA
jgi:hypothetical protein